MGSSALMASQQVRATSQAIPLLGPPAPGWLVRLDVSSTAAVISGPQGGRRPIVPGI